MQIILSFHDGGSKIGPKFSFHILTDIPIFWSKPNITPFLFIYLLYKYRVLFMGGSDASSIEEWKGTKGLGKAPTV